MLPPPPLVQSRRCWRSRVTGCSRAGFQVRFSCSAIAGLHDRQCGADLASGRCLQRQSNQWVYELHRVRACMHACYTSARPVGPFGLPDLHVSELRIWAQ
jgi:hypothetical protein